MRRKKRSVLNKLGRLPDAADVKTCDAFVFYKVGNFTVLDGNGGFKSGKGAGKSIVRAYTAVVTVPERKVAIVLFFMLAFCLPRMMRRIMFVEEVEKAAYIMVLACMVMEVHEQSRHLDELLSQGVVGADLQKQQYGDDLFQHIKDKHFRGPD
jgi:hypothetical protein